MSIKNLKALAFDTVDGMNNYDFRSPNEVLKVLKGLEERTKKTGENFTKITSNIITLKTNNTRDETQGEEGWGKLGQRSVDPAHRERRNKFADSTPKLDALPKIGGPQAAKMAAHFSSIHEYLEQLEMLDSITVRSRLAFKGSKKLSLLEKEFKARKDEIEKGLTAAMQFLAGLAEKHLPKTVELTFNRVIKPVLKELKDRYKRSSVDLSVNAFEADGGQYLQFTQTTVLENLENDTGFVYSKFYIVIQCVIDKSARHQYFVTTNYKRVPPSAEGLHSHSRGMAFNSPDVGRRLLETHLKTDEAIDIVSPGHMPLNDRDMLTVGDKVKEKIRSQEWDDREKLLNITLKPGLSDREADNVLKSILADIGGLLYNRNSISKFRNKMVDVGKSKKISIWFQTPTPKTGKLYRDNAVALRTLKENLGLDMEEVKGIQKVLQMRVAE